MMFTPYGTWLLFNSSELGDHSCNPFLGLWDKSAKEADPEIFRWNSSRFQNFKAYRVGNTQSEIQFSYVCCMFLVKLSPKFQEHLRSRKVSSHHQKPQHAVQRPGDIAVRLQRLLQRSSLYSNLQWWSLRTTPWGNLNLCVRVKSNVWVCYFCCVNSNSTYVRRKRGTYRVAIEGCLEHRHDDGAVWE